MPNPPAAVENLSTPKPAATRPIFDISERAAAQAKSVLSARPPEDRALRVKVIPGGCSGYSYNIEPWSGPAPRDDYRADFDGLTVYVDKTSLLFLAGTTLDFENTLFTRRFVFKNPNAIASCSCGDSFTVAPTPEAPPPRISPCAQKAPR